MIRLRRVRPSRSGQRLLVALCVGAALWVASASPAHALPRNCPKGQVWDPNSGSCVEKRTTRGQSAEKRYQNALAHLEGNVRRPQPKRALATLERTCKTDKHAYSCTLLGFLHFHGRPGVVEVDTALALAYYAQSCELGDPAGCLGAADVHRRGIIEHSDHRAAVPYFERACELKSGRGCFKLGEVHQLALGTTQDELKAQMLFGQALGLLTPECPKSADACFLIGEANRLGWGTAKNDAAALTAFENACTGGHGAACHQLGISYQLGLGTRRDGARALEIYDRACLQYDNAAACHDAGALMAGWDETARDVKRLANYAERACELDRKQCELLGYLFHTGIGREPSPANAARWYLVACDNGNGDACFSAGHRAMNGLGIPRDPAKAVDLWKRACNLDDPQGCEALGELHAAGEHVTKDIKKAFELFKLTCIRRRPSGCSAAAELHERGEGGVPKDRAAAANFYDIGCRLGSGSECVSLGDRVSAGRGRPANPEAARALYRKACDLDYAPGCTRLGFAYFRGDHVKKDERAAGLAFLQACQLGAARPCRWLEALLGGADDATRTRVVRGLQDSCDQEQVEEACLVLSSLYSEGSRLVGDRDARRAYELADSSCKRGYGESCSLLAHYFSLGIGVVKDDARARELYRSECDRGTARACHLLAHKLWEGRSFKDALRLYERACDEGAGSGCNMVGFAHYTAKGTRWNPTAAVKWYRRGCDAGDPVACANLGESLEYGVGIARDGKSALEYYLLGCTPESVAGCTAVGRYYHRGIEVEKDLARAEVEYRRACNDQFATGAEACQLLAELIRETGGRAQETAALEQRAFDLARDLAKENPYGKYVLASYYLRGIASVRDVKQAARLYRQACEEYDPLACRRAGDLFSGKDGGTINYEVAKVSYRRACAAGLEDACASSEALANRTPGTSGIHKRSTCACQGSPDPGTLAPLLLVLLYLLVSVRRRAPNRRRVRARR